MFTIDGNKSCVKGRRDNNKTATSLYVFPTPRDLVKVSRTFVTKWEYTFILRGQHHQEPSGDPQG